MSSDGHSGPLERMTPPRFDIEIERSVGSGTHDQMMQSVASRLYNKNFPKVSMVLARQPSEGTGTGVGRQGGYVIWPCIAARRGGATAAGMQITEEHRKGPGVVRQRA